MGIGTSRGAYFENSLDHHAGIMKPEETGDNNEWSPNEVIPQTPEPVDPSHYNTALTDEQESKFQTWKSEKAPNDSGHDYDLRGAFLNGVSPDKETGHWPDTFKKPNHPTFSDQSMYAGERPDLAGTWNGDVYVSPKATKIGVKEINPNLLDNSLYPDEKDGSPRFDRYREDEPGINQLLRDNRKGNRDTNDPMNRDPDKMLGISPTNDNNVIPYDMLYKRPGGLVHKIANLTNTPDDIMSGVEGVRAWQNRGSAGPTQMRRNANDNNKDLYNPREPNMIGSKAMDDHIDRTWKAFGDAQKKSLEAEKILGKKDFSEFDAARVRKIQREATDLLNMHNDLLNQ